MYIFAKNNVCLCKEHCMCLQRTLYVYAKNIVCVCKEHCMFMQRTLYIFAKNIVCVCKLKVKSVMFQQDTHTTRILSVNNLNASASRSYLK